MSVSCNTIGATLGSFVGKTAAYGVHGALRVAVGTGRFGADVVAGAVVGYVDKAEELRAVRVALAAQRERPVAITVTSSRERTAA